MSARRRRRAFSLIEVLSAAAIFGLGLSATFTAYNTGGQLFEHQRHTTHALHLTEGKVEELLMRVSSDGELQAGPTFGPDWFTREGFAAPAACPPETSGLPDLSDDCRYRVTWSATAGNVPRVRIITVVTTWNERGAQKSLTLSTQRN